MPETHRIDGVAAKRVEHFGIAAGAAAAPQQALHELGGVLGGIGVLMERSKDPTLLRARPINEPRLGEVIVHT